MTDPDQQKALAEAIQKRPELLFKAVGLPHGKPRQAVDKDQGLAGGIEIRWKGEGDDD